MSERDDTGRETHSSGPEHEPSEERGEAAWSAPAPIPPPAPPAPAADEDGGDGRADRAERIDRAEQVDRGEQDRRRTPSPGPAADRRRTEAADADADRRRKADPGPGPERRRTETPGSVAERFRSEVPDAGSDRRRAPASDGSAAPVGPAAAPVSSPPPWATAETSVSVPVPPLHFPPTTPPPVPPLTPPSAPAGAGTPTPLPSAGVPYGRPASPPRRNGGRVGALIVAMVVLGAGSGLGVWWVTRDHGSGPEAGPSVSVAATASDRRTSSSATPSAGESPDAPASAPDGYRLAEDPAGYALHVPADWTRRQKHGEAAVVVFYDAPSDGRQLQIFALAESTPAESLDLAENDPGYGYARQPGYQALDRTDGDGWVELSYRYDDKDKGTRQVIDHRFEAADGTLYAIRASGPDGLDPDEVRAPLEAAVNSFCPKGAQCT